MKILIVRVGQLGDMVMMTPAILALLEKYPKAQFFILTSVEGKRVLRDFSPLIKDCWIYDRKTWFPPYTRYQLAKKISNEKFEYIYCFETNPSYKRLLKNANCNVHGLYDIPLHSLSGHCAKFNYDFVNPGTNNPAYVKLFTNQTSRNRAEEILAQNGINKNDFVIAFHPSYSHLGKISVRAKQVALHKFWPVKSWATLATLIQNAKPNHNIKIIMDLTPEDKELGEEIVNASNGVVKMIIPELNFDRYKATLERVDVLITPDTGPMHIAAALRTNIVALFSGKHPKRCGPHEPEEYVSILRAEETDRPELGISVISPESVFKACEKFLPRH